MPLMRVKVGNYGPIRPSQDMLWETAGESSESEVLTCVGKSRFQSGTSTFQFERQCVREATEAR